MKTTRIKNTSVFLPRYQKVIRNHKGVPELLQRNIGLSLDNFFDHEFATGCKLLDLYWEDMDEAVVQYWKHELLTEPKHRYWAWFINQKRTNDLKFLNDSGDFIIESEIAHGLEKAKSIVQGEYISDLQAFIRIDNVHDRLRQLIQQTLLKL